MGEMTWIKLFFTAKTIYTPHFSSKSISCPRRARLVPKPARVHGRPCRRAIVSVVESNPNLTTNGVAFNPIDHLGNEIGGVAPHVLAGRTVQAEVDHRLPARASGEILDPRLEKVVVDVNVCQDGSREEF